MLQGTSHQGAAVKPHDSQSVGDWQLNSWWQKWCSWISFDPADYRCRKLQFKEYFSTLTTLDFLKADVEVERLSQPQENYTRIHRYKMSQHTRVRSKCSWWLKKPASLFCNSCV